MAKLRAHVGLQLPRLSRNGVKNHFCKGNRTHTTANCYNLEADEVGAHVPSIIISVLSMARTAPASVSSVVPVRASAWSCARLVPHLM